MTADLEATIEEEMELKVTADLEATIEEEMELRTTELRGDQRILWTQRS